MLTPGELAARLNRLVFSMLLVGHQTCTPGRRHKPRTIQHHSVWLIVKGHGTFTIDGTSYPAETDKLFILAPGMVVEQETKAEQPLEYYFFRFHYTECYEEKEQWIYTQTAQAPFPMQGMYTVTNTPQLIDLYRQLIALWQCRSPMTIMRRKLVLLEFFLALTADFRAQKLMNSAIAAIERTQEYMTKHYREPLSLETLAAMADLSVSHYSRLFKTGIGCSPIDYLTQVRVDRAKELLALSDSRLNTIAKNVGYSDAFYFSRIFKKVTGSSPSEYAKRHRFKPVFEDHSVPSQATSTRDAGDQSG